MQLNYPCLPGKGSFELHPDKLFKRLTILSGRQLGGVYFIKIYASSIKAIM